MVTPLTNGKRVLYDSVWLGEPQEAFHVPAIGVAIHKKVRTWFLMLLNPQYQSLFGIWQPDIIKKIRGGSPESFPKVNFRDALLVSKSRETNQEHNKAFKT